MLSPRSLNPARFDKLESLSSVHCIPDIWKLHAERPSPKNPTYRPAIAKDVPNAHRALEKWHLNSFSVTNPTIFPGANLTYI
jgi:hypothetical protein